LLNGSFWVKVHGGTTHFPIALIIASMLFDLVGYALNREPYSRDLHMAAFYSLLLGALASFAAMLSGLIISQWQVFGEGTLAKHHDFVWPAFALIVGLAVWRVVIRERASRRAYAAYLACSIVAAVLMATAGYWGGEMLLGG
jgi:uncharacterized membrane protein